LELAERAGVYEQVLAYLRRVRLWCQECGRPSAAEAKGWRLYRVDVPDEDPEPLLAAYCASCAAREFDSVREDGS
jgi:hypothetical protein